MNQHEDLDSIRLKLIIYVGLPASGKSYHALRRIEQNPGEYKRINRDLLREMADGGKYSEENEVCIRNSEFILAEMFLFSGFAVLIDDCNLSKKTRDMWQEFAQRMEMEMEIEDFRYVPLEICLQRDKQRDRPIGEQVIRGMYERYLKQD